MAGLFVRHATRSSRRVAPRAAIRSRLQAAVTVLLGRPMFPRCNFDSDHCVERKHHRFHHFAPDYIQHAHVGALMASGTITKEITYGGFAELIGPTSHRLTSTAHTNLYGAVHAETTSSRMAFPGNIQPSWGHPKSATSLSIPAMLPRENRCKATGPKADRTARNRQDHIQCLPRADRHRMAQSSHSPLHTNPTATRSIFCPLGAPYFRPLYLDDITILASDKSHQPAVKRNISNHLGLIPRGLFWHLPHHYLQVITARASQRST